MRTKHYISVIAFILSLVSCDGIKRKGHQVADKTRSKFVEKKDAALDKVIPTFNSYTPDTKYNRKRFAEFFGFEPTQDVTNIYCYSDQMGIDSRFQFSFKCDSNIKNRIIRYLELTREREPDNSSRGLWENFKWWDSARIVTLVPYSFKIENKYYRHLWFDDKTKTAFYFDFDL